MTSAYAEENSYNSTFSLNNTSNQSQAATELTNLWKFINAKFNTLITTLELVGSNNMLNSFNFEANVSDDLHGIPKNLDITKRDMLTTVLKENPDIASIFLVLPNGNIYLGEPYADQEQLPRLNFADREWFKGVQLHNGTYASTVFQSAAINAPALAVAIPIFNIKSDDFVSHFKDDTHRTNGYLVGILDFNSTKQMLYNSQKSSENKFYLVDTNGSQLLNSDNILSEAAPKVFDYHHVVESNLGLNTTAIYRVNDDQDERILYMRPLPVTGNLWYAFLSRPM